MSWTRHARKASWHRSLSVLLTSLVVAALLPAASAPATAPPEWRQEAESFTTKSTGAQFSDPNASGGAAWNIWTNGYVETSFTVVNAGAKQFDVVARGNVAAGVWPTMKLWLDGVAFAETTVSSTTYQTYSATKSSVGTGPHTLRIEFTNDAVIGGEDRNLKVDVATLIPSGVEEWRQEAEAFPTRVGSGQQTTDTTASGLSYYNMWTNGHLETTTMSADPSGTKQVVVYARGQVAGGVWPNMRIWVDGVQLADHSVNTTTWQPYVTLTTLAKSGSHTLRVQFTNDANVNGEDRNLKVDVAALVPVPNEWRQEAEAFTTKDTTKGIATSSTLASGGTYWNQHSNGFIQTPITVASTGRKEIRIVARGFPYAGVYPLLKVWVGTPSPTTLLTTLTVDSQTFTQYVVPATLSHGANNLKLEFTNNAGGGTEDRNLHLDVATLLGDNAFPFVQSIPFPANNSYVKAQSPLVALYADPDGDAGFVDFEVYNNSTGALVTSGRSPQTNAGDAAMWTPSGLVNGTVYKWRARAYDGSSYAGSWTAYQFFTLDTVVPVAPTVSSTTFASGAWSGTDTTSGSFTLAPGTSTDVVGYKYGLDENPPVSDTTSTSVSLTPGEGPHQLYVASVDRAGNVGPVTSYAFNVGSGAVTSPLDGDATAKWTTLRTTANPSLTTVRYEWRRAATDTWTTVPAGDVTQGGSGVTWPVTLSGGTHSDVVWNATNTLGGVDGPFEARAVYNTGATTRGTRIRLDQKTAGAAVVPAGPGNVNVLTGNFTLTATDVDVETFSGALAVNRAFNSRDPGAGATGPFGPGWVSGLSGASALFTSLTVNGSLRTASLVNGGTIGFTATSTNSFAPQEGMEGFALTRTAGSATPADQTDDTHDLTAPSGTRTVFTWQTTAFLPTTVTEPASTLATTYTYQTVSGVTRITRVLAPVPSGVSCASPDTTRGCRSLTFAYAAASTPVPGPGGGDYANRLRSISLVTWDPAGSVMATVEVARYAYQPDGRLYETWHPGLPTLRTRYAYDGAGRVTSMTPPAEEAWTFAYTTLPSDPGGGRLKSVSRSALAAGTATTTFVYGVPVSGTGAPADLSPAQLARWGQTDTPTDATAVFPPTQVPDGNQATGVLPSSYERASVHYLNVTGRAVNLLTPGGNVGVSEYDGHGNPVRELSAINRARALNASPTDTAAAEAALASRYSTLRTYGAEGRQLLDELGPEHDAVLVNGVTDSLGRVWPAGALVRARAHTVNTYDEGAPGGGPYNLVTTARSSARIADTTTDADVRTRAMQYDWTLRQATTVATDPAGLNLVARASYDTTTGLVTKETRPSGTATQDTAATTVFSYYTAGAHPAYSECGNRPEWAHLVCRTDVAAQPAVTTERPAIPTKVMQYDLFLASTVTTDKNGGTVLRTNTTTYDSAHRPWKTTTTGTGSALQTVETYYDPTTGKPTETRTLDGGGAVTARITRVFDTLGRTTSYTDADANTSTLTYDLVSRLVTTSDGKGTQTRYYDEGTERRGLLSRLVDSAAGTFTATYDADGVLATSTFPNDLVRTTTRNEAGAGVRMTYTKSGVTWLRFDASSTIHGQVATASSTLSSQSYTYDTAGRLTKVADTVNGDGCTLRSYTLDSDTNRTSMVTRQPNAEGQCDAGGPASTTTYTYDAAARTTASGYVYDTLGRTTSVPEHDAGGTDLTASYYVNDRLHTLTPQDGTQATFVLDPTQQRVRTRTQDGVTKVSHYAADGDNAIWVDEGGGAWTRNIPGIDGGLAAVQHSASGVLLQLVNLRGDVVATATTSATAPASTFESTESGTPRDGVARRFGWLGAEQRVTDPSGFMLMGARVYNPSTGRFLQVDPILGGSANSYDYGNADPVNQSDPSGMASACASWGWSLCRTYDGFRNQWWGTVAWQVYFFFSASQHAKLQGYDDNGWIDKRGMRWDENGCSVPSWLPNPPFVGLFLNSCKRHDFGYQNSKRIFVISDMYAPGKVTIDGVFLGDMTGACWSRYGSWYHRFTRKSCLAMAGTFHAAVTAGGWGPYTKGWWS